MRHTQARSAERGGCVQREKYRASAAGGLARRGTQALQSRRPKRCAVTAGQLRLRMRHTRARSGERGRPGTGGKTAGPGAEELRHFELNP